MAALSHILKVGEQVEEIMEDQKEKTGSSHLLALSISREEKVATFNRTLATWTLVPSHHHQKSPQIILRTFHLRHSCAQATGVLWQLWLNFSIVDGMAAGVGEQKPSGRGIWGQSREWRRFTRLPRGWRWRACWPSLGNCKNWGSRKRKKGKDGNRV